MCHRRLDEAGPEVVKRLQSYVPGAVLPWLNPDCPEEEVWGGDLRRVTVLFVNLGLKDHDLLAAAQYVVRSAAVGWMWASRGCRCVLVMCFFFWFLFSSCVVSSGSWSVVCIDLSVSDVC